MIERIQEMLSRGVNSEGEKDSVKQYFLSKQQELNENLISEQNQIIETLQVKCVSYENDLNKVDNLDGNFYKIRQFSPNLIIF